MPSDMDLLVATLGGVIGGGVIGVGVSEFIHWWRRPIIIMSAGRGVPYACDTLVTDRLQDKPRVRWLRLGVENKGTQVAHDCQIFLTKVELLEQCGNLACCTPLNNPLALKWAGTHDYKRNLPANVRMFMDFLRVSAADSYPRPVFETIDSQLEEILSLATLKNVVFARFHFIATANEIQSASFYADVDCSLADAKDEAAENHWKKFNWK
ncbi:MAG: hypothetical protein ACK45D_18795 [Alphaproteobacteria bacterium]|jgi:hypothetical protein